MSLKLTKFELRSQQMRLMQFQRYLPTLQLKKAMLQFEVMAAEMEISRLQRELGLSRSQVEAFSPFLLEKVTVNLVEYADILHVKKKYENIAGVEIPILEKVVFRDPGYFLFDTPAWTERATEILRELVTAREKISIAIEKKRALQKELREVSIRVNLFEKILIPRALTNISKIRIFLGDQQLAAVAQAKVAKRKIEQRKERQAP
jgi:V/A-type H+/Na+-transporting ATPase subunit D